jgi:hypothetical protein
MKLNYPIKKSQRSTPNPHPFSEETIYFFASLSQNRAKQTLATFVGLDQKKTFKKKT